MASTMIMMQVKCTRKSKNAGLSSSLLFAWRVWDESGASGPRAAAVNLPPLPRPRRSVCDYADASAVCAVMLVCVFL
jgi:hypothetical protein